LTPPYQYLASTTRAELRSGVEELLYCWSEIRAMELGGLEPPTSWVRSRRSSS
jgi:hypothetical protein